MSSLFADVEFEPECRDDWDMLARFAEEPFDYQWETIHEAISLLKRHRSVLIPLATGLGKTIVASELIGRQNKRLGRCLFLAHQKVLISQAEEAIRKHTGLWPAVEQASRRDTRIKEHARQVLVASVPTLIKRLHHFSREEFGLILCDEAHHTPAASWLAILEYFHGAKVVGLTATPMRTDEIGLDNVFEAATRMRGIEFGQENGYLAPTEHFRAVIESLDLKGVRTNKGGDFNEADLQRACHNGSDADIQKRLHFVALTIAQAANGLQGVTFMPSVEMAKRLADLLTWTYGISSACIHGELLPEQRDRYLGEFDRGERQSLVAFGCLTEGWNSWRVRYVVLGRPVASHLTMTQMCGRGTRVHGPSVFTRGHNQSSRLAAIARSPKPNCLIINIHGKNNPKQLSSLDILSGDPLPQDVRDAAMRLLDANPMPASEAIKEARRKAQDDREAKAKAQFEEAERSRVAGVMASGSVELIRSEGLNNLAIPAPGFSNVKSGGCYDWQIDKLVRLGVPEEKAIAMSKKQAFAVIGKLEKKRGLEYRVTWGEYAGRKLAEVPSWYIEKVRRMSKTKRTTELLENWDMN